MELKDDKKLNFPQGIFGEPSLPSQRKMRNLNYYGQIRINKKKLIDYLSTLESDYLFLDMIKQNENPRLLRFIVVEPKKKDNE